VELFKQARIPAQSPFEIQVVILWAAQNGHFDSIAVKNIVAASK
jgi:F0F1-type ATP synthase alpha subunit